MLRYPKHDKHNQGQNVQTSALYNNCREFNEDVSALLEATNVGIEKNC